MSYQNYQMYVSVEKRFGALHMLAGVCTVVGSFMLIAGILMGTLQAISLISIANIARVVEPGMVIMALIAGGLVFTGFMFFSLAIIAAGQWIRLFLSMEENSRRSVLYQQRLLVAVSTQQTNNPSWTQPLTPPAYPYQPEYQ